MTSRRISHGVRAFTLAVILALTATCSVSPSASAPSDAPSAAVPSLEASDASPNLRFELRDPLLTIVDLSSGWAEQPEVDPDLFNGPLILGDAATGLAEADRAGLSSEAIGAIEAVIGTIRQVRELAEAEPVDVDALKAKLRELAELARTALQLLG